MHACEFLSFFNHGDHNPVDSDRQVLSSEKVHLFFTAIRMAKQKNKKSEKTERSSGGGADFSLTALKEKLISYACRYDFLLLGIILYLAYNFCTGFGWISGDVFPASILPIALLKNHNVYFDFVASSISNPDISYAFPFVNGHYVSFFPIVTPVLVTPVYAASYILSALAGVTSPNNMYIIAKCAASFLAALAGVLIYLTGKEIFTRRIALLTTFIFAFATSTWSISSQALWQQGTVELLLIALIYLAVKNEKQPSAAYIFLMGILSALFVFNRPPESILLIPVLVYIVWYQREKIPWYLAGGVLAGLPFLYYNYSIFGNAFGGYAENLALFTVNTGFIGHYLGLLFSPNVGLFVYCPVLLLSIAGMYFVWKGRVSPIRTLVLAAVPAILLDILLYSFFGPWSSSAEFCYGLRFLTGLVPVLCLFTGFFLDEWFGHGKARHQSQKKPAVIALVAALVIVSVGIQFVGTFFYGWSSTSNKSMTDERAWNATDSVIIRSYTEGSPRIAGIFWFTLPPVPPLVYFPITGG